MRVLHLSHHAGAIADFEYVGDRLGLSLSSAAFDDGYNIGSERADRAWRRWRDRLLAVDVVLVSDTAPLSRIVLQHLDEFAGRLVIWVCNRFDYHDAATNDCGFPDPAYYDLFRDALRHPRVSVAGFTAFEALYARMRGVELGDRVVKPLGRRLAGPAEAVVPASVDKGATVFVPPYHNDTRLVDLAAVCAAGDVAVYSGRYGGPLDLRGFRAVAHVPYSWSTFAFFEHVQNAIPVFVPSPRFLLELARDARFWWPDREHLEQLVGLSEWYAPTHDFLVYFESWEDMQGKLAQLELGPVRERMAAYARMHERATLRAWRALLQVA